MKHVPLTQGFTALVDDDDYLSLSGFKWCAVRINNKVYALRWNGRGASPRVVYMHRQILGVGPGQLVDHRNGQGTDCQRHNLRICTGQENRQNRCPNRDKDCGYKGVVRRSSGRWEAKIGHNGCTHVLGRFPSPVAAALAYDRAAQKLFGEFAWLNFPTGASLPSSHGAGTHTPNPQERRNLPHTELNRIDEA